MEFIKVGHIFNNMPYKLQVLFGQNNFPPYYYCFKVTSHLHVCVTYSFKARPWSPPVIGSRTKQKKINCSLILPVNKTMSCIEFK